MTDAELFQMVNRQRVCRQCGKVFLFEYGNQKMCSEGCRKARADINGKVFFAKANSECGVQKATRADILAMQEYRRANGDTTV